MLGLLALGEESVAALADHSAEGMRGRCCGRRALPRADASTVDICGKLVPVVAGTLEDVGSYLRGVPGDRGRTT